MSASLDRMCKGRMALNVVNGWFDEEFTMFGGTVLRGPERYQRSKEFIEILRGLWQNESFSIDGEFYKLKDAKLLLKPATSTPPEIFSVSFGDDGREFVAETCDWWFINYPKEAETTDDVLRAIEECVKDMSRRAERLGRKMRFGINPFVALGPDEETAIERNHPDHPALRPRRRRAQAQAPDAAQHQGRLHGAGRSGCETDSPFPRSRTRPRALQAHPEHGKRGADRAGSRDAVALALTA